jgi:lipopolysaccharide export system protein LptA
VADTAPPSGQVEAPPTTTVSKPSADSAPGTGSSSAVEGTLDAVAPGTAAPAPNKLKAASIKDSARAHKDKGDSSESGSDSSPFAGFENNSNHGPINIKSDTMSFDYKKSVVIFSGRVHAVQAGNELSSNTLHVQMNKSNQIQEMIADGNVRMSQGQRWATGDHAVLDESLHTLVLTGSPVVHDGNDQIAGTKITVYLQTNKSEVTDPKAVIFPRESKNPNNSVAPTTGAATAATGE